MTTTSCKMVFNLVFSFFPRLVWSEMTPLPLFCLVIWYVTMEATVGFYTTAGPNSTNSSDASLPRGLWSELVMVITTEWKPFRQHEKGNLVLSWAKFQQDGWFQSSRRAAVSPPAPAAHPEQNRTARRWPSRSLHNHVWIQLFCFGKFQDNNSRG